MNSISNQTALELRELIMSVVNQSCEGLGSSEIEKQISELCQKVLQSQVNMSMPDKFLLVRSMYKFMKSDIDGYKNGKSAIRKCFEELNNINREVFLSELDDATIYTLLQGYSKCESKSKIIAPFLQLFHEKNQSQKLSGTIVSQLIFLDRLGEGTLKILYEALSKSGEKINEYFLLICDKLELKNDLGLFHRHLQDPSEEDTLSGDESEISRGGIELHITIPRRSIVADVLEILRKENDGGHLLLKKAVFLEGNLLASLKGCKNDFSSLPKEFNSLNYEPWAEYIKIRPKDRESVLSDAMMLWESWKDIPEESAWNFYGSSIVKHRMLIGIAAIPPDERQNVLRFFPSYEEFNKYNSIISTTNRGANGIIALYLLLPFPGQVDPSTYPTMLKIALIQKLEDSTLPFSTSVALSRFVLERRVNLGLSLNDRLIQLASFFKYVNDFPQWKRPLEVFDKLEALAIEPFVFQSKAFDVDGSTFVIPLESLIKLYKSANVKREDLPTMVTPEAYEQFCQQLHYKVEFNPDDSDLALEDLQTTWNTISNPIFNDPTDYLAILIGTSTGDVSEDETKWKAVLHSVFEKSNAAKEGCFFTEQEEAFIIIMRGIQGCTFGLSAGIAAAYQYSIEDKYHYSVDLPLPDSPEVIVEKKRKMEVLGKLSQPIRKKGCLSIIDLRKSVNQNRENKEMAYSLVSEENCWDYEEDDINMELNDEGAKALWKALQEERKKKCMTFVGQKIFSFLEQQIDGENLMKSLCDEIKKIDQGAHQWIYLKNLIGPIFGFVKNIRFDMHTGLLYDSLLKKTREEVLSIFFEYVTPQAVVNELIRAVNADLEENKDLLAPLLSDDYWNQQGLTVQGALALLLKSGLIRHG